MTERMPESFATAFKMLQKITGKESVDANILFMVFDPEISALLNKLEDSYTKHPNTPEAHKDLEAQLKAQIEDFIKSHEQSKARDAKPLGGLGE